MAKSRKSITQGRGMLKDKLNVKKQVFALVRRKPKALFAGSAVAGLATTLLLRRPRKSRKKERKTLSQMLFSWIFLLLKPTAKKWIQKSLKTYAIGQLNNFTQKRQNAPMETSSEPPH